VRGRGTRVSRVTGGRRCARYLAPDYESGRSGGIMYAFSGRVINTKRRHHLQRSRPGLRRAARRTEEHRAQTPRRRKPFSAFGDVGAGNCRASTRSSNPRAELDAAARNPGGQAFEARTRSSARTCGSEYRATSPGLKARTGGRLPAGNQKAVIYRAYGNLPADGGKPGLRGVLECARRSRWP